MGDVKICDITDAVRDEIKKFRFSKNNDNAALILKVDRDKQIIVVDEYLEDVSIADLQELLPGHQPRYIVYTYRMVHDDSRVSHPMCFIFYTPRDSHMGLQMMYAGTKTAIQQEVGVTKVFEVRDLDDFTEDWLREKLK
ncbi:unnamed protein product [Hermetia illucens]|uniref:ADF-H domain-containing protein n=1 Tax=Hermetia illucens TaxID=343691 RepID=A0A7R8YNY4_HERIL|nr:glia maturation factor beta [Hermetia illucens]CAD7080058.1 unnamed protein product [Hermetia illucens]